MDAACEFAAFISEGKTKSQFREKLSGWWTSKGKRWLLQKQNTEAPLAEVLATGEGGLVDVYEDDGLDAFLDEVDVGEVPTSAAMEATTAIETVTKRNAMEETIRNLEKSLVEESSL